MGLREENKAAKRRRLLEAAKAEFLVAGYAAASIENIVANADVARGTFYLYFDSKESVFQAVVSELFTTLTLLTREARDELKVCVNTESTFPIYTKFGHSVVALLVSHTDEVRIYFAEERTPTAGGKIVRSYIAEVETIVREILEDAVVRGILRPHDTHAAALAIMGGIERLTWAWFSNDSNLDITRLPEEVTRLFRFGLSP